MLLALKVNANSERIRSRCASNEGDSLTPKQSIDCATATAANLPINVTSIRLSICEIQL